MRLGIDLDGVVANFTEGWQRFYNREFGTDLVVEDSKRWNDLVDLTHFANMREFWAWSSNLEGRSVFWHLEPYPGALTTLHHLADRGHQIVVITQKPHFAISDTHEWLQRVGMPTDEVHILGINNGKKWDVECDVYLDDGPHVIPGLVRHWPDRLVCRYVRPWNDPVEGAIDVRDWDEFRELVERSS